MGSYSAACTLAITMLLIVCILLIITGFLLPPVVNNVIQQKIIKNKLIDVDETNKYTDVLKKFIDPPFPMKMEVWVYNITDSLSLMDGVTDTAHIDEIGPFTFNITMHKELTINEDATRMSYRTFRRYTFDQDASCNTCSLEDYIFVANPSFQGVVEKSSGLTSAAIEFLLLVKWNRLETIYRNVTVAELLFDGYKDNVIEYLCSIPLSNCPSLPPRIGLFFAKNNTNDDGEYEVDTGKEDVTRLGQVYSWNNLSPLNESYWFGEQARMINGTDSQLYPPFTMLNRKNFQLFIGQACRSVEMEFKSFSVVNGLPMQRYSPSKAMITDSFGQGFCGDKHEQKFYDDQIGTCPPRGLMEMDGCNPQAVRVYVANGHFYDSDERLRDGLEGFPEPNADSDVTFLDIEPHIGLVVQAQSRSLISIGVMGKRISSFSRMKERVMPLIFINNSVVFDIETSNLIYKAIWTIHLMAIAPFILLTLSLTTLIISFMLMGRHHYRSRILSTSMMSNYTVGVNSVTMTLMSDEINLTDAKTNIV